MKLSALVKKEIREIVYSRAFWLMMLVLCPLVGYSFIEAVDLYEQGSHAVAGNDLLTARISPLDGILVPTFSSLYLATTFLFPFVAIRSLGSEKQSGSIKLLLQVLPNTYSMVAAKALVVLGFWMLSLIPPVSAVLIWKASTGHMCLPEVLNLLLGHLLYAMLVTSIAFFAVAVSESIQTAAIVTLAFTIGSWVLEFASGNPGAGKYLSFLSMTRALRQFESGIFALPVLLGIVVASLALLSLSCIFLSPGYSANRRARLTLISIAVSGLFAFMAANAFYYADLSERRANSFNPKNEAELRKLNKPLKLIIHLDPDDSVAIDFERYFLSKMRRVVKDVTVEYVSVPPPDEFGGGGGGASDKYGLIYYDYGGVRMQGRQIGPNQALEALHMLTGTRLQGEVLSPYPGYPATMDVSMWQPWFYGALPAVIIASWWTSTRRKFKWRSK